MTRHVEPAEAIADLKAFLADIKQFPLDDTFRYETDRGGVYAILAAIRAAENDALERAAVAIIAAREDLHCADMDEDYGADKATEVYADVIRALKHKEIT